MIRVLRIINRFNLGGPTYNAAYLSAFLGDEFETKLIGGKHEKGEGESEFILKNLGVEYEIVEDMQREINYKSDKKALKKIREIIREFKPDIVHTHASKAGYLGRTAAHKEGVPIIVHTFHGHVFHSYFGALKTSVFKKIERRMARKSDAIIAISDIQKHELSSVHKIVSEDKLSVIPLGFDLQRFQEDKETKRREFRGQHQIDEDEIAIGIIGRLTAIKNHTLFLESAERVLKETEKKIKFLIIGDGELRPEIEAEVKGIESQIGGSPIILTSWIKEIDKALPGLDIVCLTSLNEGTPVSLIEAQAAGIPVISTNVGGVKNVVDHENTGLVVDSFDSSDFIEAMMTLINDEEKRRKMSQNGWNHVKDIFHYERLCSDVEKLYKELLNKKGIEK